MTETVYWVRTIDSGPVSGEVFRERDDAVEKLHEYTRKYWPIAKDTNEMSRKGLMEAEIVEGELR
ncbi:hypothetical protein ACFQE1_02050 [Halobium palmae]|uniref:Uncharacterized protein n=1 Tax=Halobium palmae TaxID=1776492 RepID=A0ABD5RW75_9EURY